MSTRKALDMLGETHLPDDLFTDTDGLNWMLDTYPDLGKGLGVLDGQVLQEPRQPPNLPDGIVMADDENMDLTDEGGFVFGSMGDIEDITHEASLQDLSWLELAEQDPERLPENPVDLSIPELEEAWGVDSRTDGISFTPNVDREAANYEASLTASDDISLVSAEEVGRAVRKASRQVAAGASFANVARETAERLGADASEARTAMTQLKDDAGLLGRVFIRAADYPGCANGEWSDLVRQKSAGSAYLVQKKACGGCVNAQNGSCSIFKKQLVASVPWDDALRRYAPALEASGRKVASGTDAKTALRKAFAQAPKGLQAAGDVRPTHLEAADQIGSEEARKAFAAAPSLKLQVLNATRAEAHTNVTRWRAKGMLTAAQAERLMVSKAAPAEVLRTAARLISATKQGAYSGGLNAGKMGYVADDKTVFAELDGAERRAAQAETFIREEMARREFAASHEGKRLASIEVKASAVVKQMDMGLCGRALVAHILRSFEAADRGIAAEILDPIIKSRGALKEAKAKVGTYSGLTNDTRVSDVSADDAWAKLRASNVPAAIDLETRRQVLAHRKMVGMLGRWVRDGLLPKAAAERLAKSTAHPREVLRIAAALVGRGRVAAYSGVANDVRVPEVSPEEAWKMLAAAEAGRKHASAAVAAEADRRAHASSRAGKREVVIRAKAAKVVEAINRGLRGSPLLNYIRKVVAKDEVGEVSKLINPVLRKTGALDTSAAAPREYDGAVYERAPTEAPKVAAGPAFGETDRLARWARQQMSEGYAGKDLSDLMVARFASSVRTAASSMIQQLRAKHEGLSGHLYVDADAYASKTGTAGCEKGALKHRANQIPAVLQMSRCGSCSLRVAKADGTPVCSMYNKALVASAPTENPKAFQREMLRLADGTDADRTASLFANTYEDDFQLGLDGEMDHLNLEDLPANEEMGDIFFGGMEFE